MWYVSKRRQDRIRTRSISSNSPAHAEEFTTVVDVGDSSSSPNSSTEPQEVSSATSGAQRQNSPTSKQVLDGIDEGQPDLPVMEARTPGTASAVLFMHGG